MSWSQALETLGFSEGSLPTDDEVRHAQRKRLVEIGYKGLGGDKDPKEATEVNVAADILLKRRDADRSTIKDPEEPTWNPTYSRPEPQKKKEVTFEEAKAKASVPSGVEWLFVTSVQKGEGSYSGDESSQRKDGWVAVGKTDQKFVFVGVEHSAYSAYYIGGGPEHDIYKIRTYEYAKPNNLSPSWLVGNIVKALHDMDINVHFNHKVCDARGREFSQKMPATGGAELSTKHMMVELGMVDEDDPSVANRKHVVEMKVELDHRFGGDTAKPGFFPAPAPSNMYWDGAYHGDYYKITLILNGKDYDLSESDWNTFYRLKIGGKRLLDAIFGDRVYGGSKKNITRMPKAKSTVILGGLVERLKDLPPAAMAVLAKAAEQVKGDKASP